MKIFIKKDIIQNTELSASAIYCYVTLKAMLDNTVEKTDMYITINSLYYFFNEQIPTRKTITKLIYGMSELIYYKIISAKEISNNEFIIDISTLEFNSKKNFFILIEKKEIISLMKIKTNKDKYKLLRYLLTIIGSFNHKEGEGKVGYNSINNMAELSGISAKSITEYNQILEDNQIIYIHRSEEYCRLDGGQIKSIVNNYSLYCDKDFCIKKAKAFCNQFADNKIKKTINANTSRALKQKYNYLIKGKKYDEETIKQIYNYAIEFNKIADKEYNRQKELGYNGKDILDRKIDLDIFNFNNIEIHNNTYEEDK